MKSFIAALRNLVLPFGRTTGRRIVLDGDNGRIDVYNAADQLVARIDSAEPPGLTVGASTGAQVKVVTAGTTGRIDFPTNRAVEDEDATILAGVLNSGLPNEALTLQLLGPIVDTYTDRSTILISSQNADGTSEANIQFNAGTGIIRYNETMLDLDGPRLSVSPDASASPVLSLNADASHTGNVLQAGLSTTVYAQITSDGRTLLTNMSSASSALFINTGSGHTGNLLRAQLNGTDKFVVGNAGDINVYAGNTFNTYTPTVSGGGAATFSTRTGWYQRLGKEIFFTAYFVVGVAGSGASVVQVTAPSSIDRTTRQTIPMHGSGLGGPGAGEYSALCFVGGSGSTIDRLTRGGTDLTGANLNAGSIVTITGRYREA